MDLVGFIISIYHDAWSPERQIRDFDKASKLIIKKILQNSIQRTRNDADRSVTQELRTCGLLRIE